MDAKTLLSRYIRSNISAGKTGKDVVKRLEDNKGVTQPAPKAAIRKILSLSKLDKGGKIPFLPAPIQALWQGATWILSGAAKIIGFVVAPVLGWLKIDMASLWSLIVGVANFLWRFDWNASDEALQQTISEQNLMLASIWGGVVGQGLGWVAGISVGYGISFLCPVIGGATLARTVATAAGREALEEVLPAIGNAIRLTATAVGKSALINGYINYRKFLKNAPSGLIETIFGKDTAYFIRNVWGNKGGPNMSFSTQLEERIDKIDNKYVKAFLEELLEETWDSFTEAGFVIAHEIDQAYAQQKAQQQRELGPERTITLEPDNRVESELLTFASMPQNQLIPLVQQTVNTHRLLHNRDVGMVIGTPVDEYVRAKPQSLRLVINMFSVKEPPFTQRGKEKLTRVTITVPDVKKGKLDWEGIKAACGGSNGYMWGRFRATANLDNGRQMAVYGASAAEAEERLKAFILLTDAKLLTLAVTEEKKEGRRLETSKLYKESVRVYPAYFTVVNREQILDPSKGEASLKQNYMDKRSRIELWPTTQPYGSQQRLIALLQRAS